MFESVRQWLDRINKSIQERGRKKSPEPAPDVEEKNNEQRFAEALGGFSDFFERASVDSKEYDDLLKFGYLGEEFRKLGYRAGHWGIKAENINEIAKMRVRITKNQIEEKYASEQRKLQSKVEILKKIKINAERDYKSKNSYYERLNRAYQYSHRQFSLLLGVIYGFFSVALVLADIPLALELTRRGFNLKSDLQNPISDLFRYGGDEGFLFNFLKVLTVNWEVVLFAVGIAFCTIYIKVYYDDFIGSPLENLIKKSPESPKESYEELQEEVYQSDSEKYENNKKPENDKLTVDKSDAVRSRFNRLWRIRFVIKTLVLLILFTAIFILGYFRYSVVLSQQDSEIKGISPIVIFYTYTMLTLLFPIISGICGSLSLNCFHNWREKTRAERKNSEAQQKLLDATDEYQVKLEEQVRSNSFLEWLKNADGQLTEYLIACYGLGFNFGYMHPEWLGGGDLFTRAEALRQRNLINPKGFPPDSPIEIKQDIIN